jgi:hypothetical protein
MRIGRLEITTAVGFDVGLFLLVSGGLTVLIRHLTGLMPADETEPEGDG